MCYKDQYKKQQADMTEEHHTPQEDAVCWGPGIRDSSQGTGENPRIVQMPWSLNVKIPLNSTPPP